MVCMSSKKLKLFNTNHCGFCFSFYDNPGEIHRLNGLLWNHFVLKSCLNPWKMHLVLFKRIVVTSFGVFRYKNHFRGKKMKIKNQTTAEFTSVFDPRQVFSKKSLFDPFLRFQNFQKLKFLSFLVFHQKFFFSELQNYFCSTKKIFGSAAQKFAKILTCLGGGGWKIDLIPPPRKKIVDFARIVVKWKKR